MLLRAVVLVDVVKAHRSRHHPIHCCSVPFDFIQSRGHKSYLGKGAHIRKFSLIDFHTEIESFTLHINILHSNTVSIVTFEIVSLCMYTETFFFLIFCKLLAVVKCDFVEYFLWMRIYSHNRTWKRRPLSWI